VLPELLVLPELCSPERPIFQPFAAVLRPTHHFLLLLLNLKEAAALVAGAFARTQKPATEPKTVFANRTQIRRKSRSLSELTL